MSNGMKQQYRGPRPLSIPKERPVDPVEGLPNVPVADAEPLPFVGFGDMEKVTLTLPLAPIEDWDADRNQTTRTESWHVDCQFRDRHQQKAFYRLYKGLDVAGVRLNSGDRIHSAADVLRWLAEQIELTSANNNQKGAFQ